MRKRHPWAYVPWVARDYFLWGGVATMVIVAFLALFVLEPAYGYGAMRNPKHPFLGTPKQVMSRAIGQACVILAFIGPIVATRGIVASDRVFGYFRLLFARPQNAALYYAQVFLINGAGFLLIAGVMGVAFNGFIAPLPVGRLLWTMALAYVLFGGVMFLLSALWRYDLLTYIAVFVASIATWDILHSDGVKGWLVHARWFVDLLPPMTPQMDIVMTVGSGVAAPPEHVIWTLGYGLVCAGLAVWVIGSRQFAKGS